jgi:recombination protein RecT
MATTEIISKNLQELREMLIKAENRIGAVLPASIRADKMISVTLELVQGDSKLSMCTPPSILAALLEASQLGLMLTKNLGHGYLVPYRNGQLSTKYKTDVFDAKFIVGYRGFIDLVLRGDEEASNVFSSIVYPDDPEFQIYQGTRHEIVHVPGLDGSFPYKGENAEINYVGAYAVVTYATVNGKVRPPDFEWMNWREVEKVRAVSKAASKDSPWFTWPEAMIAKCPIRKLCKRLKLSPDTLAATVRDEYRELGYEDQRTTYTLQDGDYGISEPKAKTKEPEKKDPEPPAETIKGPLMQKILAALRESGKTPQQMGGFLTEKYKTDTFSDIPASEADVIFKWIGPPAAANGNGKAAEPAPQQQPIAAPQKKSDAAGIGKQKAQELNKTAEGCGWASMEWTMFICQRFGINDIAELNPADYDRVKGWAQGGEIR